MKNIEANRKAAPEISLDIRCYHTETRYYTDMDGDEH